MKRILVLAAFAVAACGGGETPDCAPAGTYRATFVRNATNPGDCSGGVVPPTDVRVKEGEACGSYTYNESGDVGGGCGATLSAHIEAHRSGFSNGKATWTVACSDGRRCTAFFDLYLDKP